MPSAGRTIIACRLDEISASRSKIMSQLPGLLEIDSIATRDARWPWIHRWSRERAWRLFYDQGKVEKRILSSQWQHSSWTQEKS